MTIKTSKYKLQFVLKFSLRKLIILSFDESLKRSFIVLALKYLARIWPNSTHETRRCLTVNGLLQDMQNGGSSLFNKYACVSRVCPMRQRVSFV